MAQSGQTTIRLYASTTADAVPSSANLVSGELALNLTDRKIYTKNGSGDIIEITLSPINPTFSGTLSGGAGAFTTLSASGSVTLSGGTANGLLYLNGSKVATSGSALTWDGSTLSAGNGTASAFMYAVGPNSGTSAGASFIAQNGVGNPIAAIGNYSAIMGGAYDATGTVWSPGNLRMVASGATRGTFDSAGLSVPGEISVSDDSGSGSVLTVGRYSAGYPWSLIRASTASSGLEFRSYAGVTWATLSGTGLTVSGAVVAGNVVSGGQVAVSNSNGLTLSDDVAGGFLSYGYNSGRTNTAHHAWYNGISTELMRLNSVGLTVTGKVAATTLAIGSPANPYSRPWALKGMGYLGLATGEGFEIYHSATNDYSYFTSETAGLVWNSPREQRWIAAGGTMVWTGSNLGIGTASVTPVWGATTQIGGGTGAVSLSLVGASGSGFFAINNSGAAQLIARAGTILQLGANDAATLTIGIDGTMTVGTTKIEAGPGYAGINTVGAIPLIFYINGVEKARLVASGNLGVGTSSPGVKIESSAADTSLQLRLRRTNTSTAFADIGVDNTGFKIWSDGYGTTSVAPNFTLTQTGLGIGTSSPGAKLQVGDAGSAAPVKILIRSASADTYLQSTSTGSVIGTPNGVPLLFNTNDAERMRLDASGNLGLGVVPTYKLDVLSGAAEAVRARSSNSDTVGIIESAGTATSLLRFINTGANNVYLGSVSGSLVAYTSGATAMTLDSSGNLTVGATGGDGVVRGHSSADGTIASFRRLGGTYNTGLFIGNVDSTQEVSLNASGSGGNPFFTFKTSNIERMRIDSAGNLGLGVTPYGWISYKSFEAGIAGFAGNSSGSGIATNAYYDGAWKYKTTGAASLVGSSNGRTDWYAAASGSAGAAITWTTLATLDANGCLGIGRISPSANVKLIVSNAGNLGFEFDPTNSSGTVGMLEVYDRTAAAYKAMRTNALSHTWYYGASALFGASLASDGRFYVGAGTSAKFTSTVADGTFQGAFVGTSKAIRLNAANDRFRIEAVDETLTGSYQPLQLAGSVVYLAVGGTVAATLNASGVLEVSEAGTGSGSGGFTASTAAHNGNAGMLFKTNSANRWNVTTAGTNGATLRVYNYSTGASAATWDASSNLVNAGSVTTSKALFSAKAAVSASDIDVSTANAFSKTISGNTTFTVSNVPASGTLCAFTLDLTNAGAYTVTWWSGVKWAGGAAPTLTASGRDRLVFMTTDGGTTWDAFVLGKAMA